MPNRKWKKSSSRYMEQRCIRDERSKYKPRGKLEEDEPKTTTNAIRRFSFPFSLHTHFFPLLYYYISRPSFAGFSFVVSFASELKYSHKKKTLHNVLFMFFSLLRSAINQNTNIRTKEKPLFFPCFFFLPFVFRDSGVSERVVFLRHLCPNDYYCLCRYWRTQKT